LFGEEIGVVVQKSRLPGEYKIGHRIIVTGRAAIGNRSFFDDRIDNSPRWGRRISVMIAQCLISFGSNLGDRDDLIASAARRIADSSVAEPTCPLTTSRVFETPPIGGPGGQEPFLNAIGRFDTRASAREILELLQQIELELGRQRRQRWGARSIDLDVVLHGELVGGGSGLTVPHPRYTARQFVLQPACDVAADLRDPRFGWTLQRLTDHLSAGVPSLALVGGDWRIRQQICDRLSAEYGIQTFADQPSTHPIGVVANVPSSLHGAPESTGGATAAAGQRIVAPLDRAGAGGIAHLQPAGARIGVEDGSDRGGADLAVRLAVFRDGHRGGVHEGFDIAGIRLAEAFVICTVYSSHSRPW
jgi:2-amino-4-hydroxy-6-hydroxymethyldihydropteridine diphosphokinase